VKSNADRHRRLDVGRDFWQGVGDSCDDVAGCWTWRVGVAQIDFDAGRFRLREVGADCTTCMSSEWIQGPPL
jgi:hypothetical protein